jgi:hypothetical protein
MKTFEFRCTEGDGDSVVVITEEVFLPKILETFERFLKGVGYHFDGVVDIVKEE